MNPRHGHRSANGSSRHRSGHRSSLVALALLVAALIAGPMLAASGDPSGWMNETPEQPDHVLVRGATIWTSGPDGILENADLLVERGTIRAIGQGLEAPEGAVVIEAAGKHLTPGLIDAHSHAAILGGVNESTNIVTAEVRIGDVIDSESIQIYRQLAGGVTTINLLHGSSNAIGGQNAVIKLRWGATPDELLFAEAPQGVKFALGENPKQSNFTPDEPRYPQTRLGVEQVIRQAFLAARDYRAAQEAHATASSAGPERRGRRAAPETPPRVPPRRDLQLEAIVEMLDGTRLIHSHSYRADEILMLLRLTEEFGTKVASLQHVLEGYKVADEIAAHGAGASTFSDWWAYKYEVVDAIPHNGAILWDRGVVTSFNSDSSELARRLNLEAAKAVRYGGVPEDEALKFVTLNPAIQLGIQDLVGSLEVGKHADFTLWNGHPLSTYTLCEQTWVDGRRYFDRAHDLEMRQTVQAERQALLDKVRAAAASDEKEAEKNEAEGEGEKAGTEESPPEPPEQDPPPQNPTTATWTALFADTNEEVVR